MTDSDQILNAISADQAELLVSMITISSIRDVDLDDLARELSETIREADVLLLPEAAAVASTVAEAPVALRLVATVDATATATAEVALSNSSPRRVP